MEGDTDAALLVWIDRFEEDKKEAGLQGWFETKMGIDESLREFDLGC